MASSNSGSAAMSVYSPIVTHYFNRTERLASGAEQDILNVPLNTVRAGMDVDLGRVSARLSGRYVQGRKDNNFNLPGFPIIDYDDFTVIDASATVRLARQHAALVSDQQPVRRVLLRETGIPAAGRVVQAVVSLRVLAMTRARPPGVRDRGRCRDRAPVRRLGCGQHDERVRRPVRSSHGLFPGQGFNRGCGELHALSTRKSYKVVSIKEAYAGGPPERYVLIQCGTPPPVNETAAERIMVPISSLYSASTTHLALLVDLGRLDVLTGVSRLRDLTGDAILQRAASGQVREFSAASVIDSELVVSGRPSRADDRRQ